MRHMLKSHPEKGQQTNKNKPRPKTTMNQKPLSATHWLLSTQQAWEAHTEKVENLGRPHHTNETIQYLYFCYHNTIDEHGFYHRSCRNHLHSHWPSCYRRCPRCSCPSCRSSPPWRSSSARS